MKRDLIAWIVAFCLGAAVSYTWAIATAGEVAYESGFSAGYQAAQRILVKPY